MKFCECSLVIKLLFFFLFSSNTDAFQVARPFLATRRYTLVCIAAEETTGKKDNKAMAFLRKKGKVGGSANQFTKSMGVDEGPAGKSSGSAGGIKVSRDIREIKQHLHPTATLFKQHSSL